jgi:hypothetical protein
MEPASWTRGDLLLAGGTAVALASSADAAWAVYARFAVDLAGLSAVERAGAALWDFRPLASAVFAAAGLAILAGLREPAGRLARLGEPARNGVAFLAASHAVLALAVLALAVWVAAAGEVGGADELGFVYGTGERAVTLVTQALAWVPLGVLFVLVAWAATAPQRVVAAGLDEEAVDPEEGVFAEMESLWRERLALGPRREQARRLLGRIQALEEAGDHEAARVLADEMRRL